MRVNGRYVEGAITFDGMVWAEQRTNSARVDIERTLFITRGDRVYRIRYRPDVANSHVMLLKVVVDGITFAIDSVDIDPRDRDRYLDLTMSQELE